MFWILEAVRTAEGKVADDVSPADLQVALVEGSSVEVLFKLRDDLVSLQQAIEVELMERQAGDARRI